MNKPLTLFAHTSCFLMIIGDSLFRLEDVESVRETDRGGCLRQSVEWMSGPEKVRFGHE